MRAPSLSSRSRTRPLRCASIVGARRSEAISHRYPHFPTPSPSSSNTCAAPKTFTTSLRGVAAAAGDLVVLDDLAVEVVLAFDYAADEGAGKIVCGLPRILLLGTWVNKGARTLSHARAPGGEGVVGGGVGQPGEARAVRVHHVYVGGVVLGAVGGEGDAGAVWRPRRWPVVVARDVR